MSLHALLMAKNTRLQNNAIPANVSPKWQLEVTHCFIPWHVASGKVQLAQFHRCLVIS